jgi:hypothetical protein
VLKFIDVKIKVISRKEEFQRKSAAEDLGY